MSPSTPDLTLSHGRLDAGFEVATIFYGSEPVLNLEIHREFYSAHWGAPRDYQVFLTVFRDALVEANSPKVELGFNAMSIPVSGALTTTDDGQEQEFEGVTLEESLGRMKSAIPFSLARLSSPVADVWAMTTGQDDAEGFTVGILARRRELANLVAHMYAETNPSHPIAGAADGPHRLAKRVGEALESIRPHGVDLLG